MADPWPEGVLAQFLAMPPPAKWSAAAWRTACRVIADGGSYREAAAAAGKSANALLGAAHRRGFPVRPSPIRPAGSGGRPGERKARAMRPRAGAKAIGHARGLSLQAERPVAASRSLAPPAPVRPLLTRPDARGCLFPLGDPREPCFRFCAAVDVVVGRSYCAEHCRIAYTRTVEEVDRAAAVARQVVGTPLHRPYVVAERAA